MNDPTVFDTDPVVFKRNKYVKPKPVSRQTSQNRKLENETIVKIDKIDKKTARILQQGRCAKKLSQKELALRLQIPIKTIQLIENGKAPKNRALWQKIARFLSVKI